MRTPPPRDDLRFSNTTGILQKKLCGLLEEMSAPTPEKNPGSAPVNLVRARQSEHALVLLVLAVGLTFLS